MFTINELQSKRSDYTASCFVTIQELLSEIKRVEFDVDDVENCPYCIGDNYLGIIDGIIKAVEINNDNIIITYVDNEDTNCNEIISEIENLVHCDYIDLIIQIKKKLENG